MDKKVKKTSTERKKNKKPSKYALKFRRRMKQFGRFDVKTPTASGVETRYYVYPSVCISTGAVTKEVEEEKQ